MLQYADRAINCRLNAHCLTRSDSFRTGGLTLLVDSLPLSEKDCRVPRGVVSQEVWRTKVINEEETARILSKVNSNRSQNTSNLVHGTLLIIYSANKRSRTPCVDAVLFMDWKIGAAEGNPEAIQVTDLGVGSLGLGQLGCKQATSRSANPTQAVPPLHRSWVPVSRVTRVGLKTDLHSTL